MTAKSLAMFGAIELLTTVSAVAINVLANRYDDVKLLGNSKAERRKRWRFRALLAAWMLITSLSGLALYTFNPTTAESPGVGSPAPLVSTPQNQDTPPPGWRVIAQQSFLYPNGPAVQPYHDPAACGDNASAKFLNQTLLVKLDSCQDYTYQISYESVPPSTGTDYYFTADVQYVSGPTDGYCALLVGWQDKEHWYALKLGYSDYEVTHDKGGLPHQRLEGPSPYENTATLLHRLTVISQGSEVDFFVDGARVSDQQSLSNISGQTWLAVQAANDSDLITCAFSNVELREP